MMQRSWCILLLQPEVDPKRISIIGHSDGTVITPRVAIVNSTTVNRSTEFSRYSLLSICNLPLAYATQVLDKNHAGLISIQHIAKEPCVN